MGEREQAMALQLDTCTESNIENVKESRQGEADSTVAPGEGTRLWDKCQKKK